MRKVIGYDVLAVLCSTMALAACIEADTSSGGGNNENSDVDYNTSVSAPVITDTGPVNTDNIENLATDLRQIVLNLDERITVMETWDVASYDTDTSLSLGEELTRVSCPAGGTLTERVNHHHQMVERYYGDRLYGENDVVETTWDGCKTTDLAVYLDGGKTVTVLSGVSDGEEPAEYGTQITIDYDSAVMTTTVAGSNFESYDDGVWQLYYLQDQTTLTTSTGFDTVVTDFVDLGEVFTYGYTIDSADLTFEATSYTTDTVSGAFTGGSENANVVMTFTLNGVEVTDSGLSGGTVTIDGTGNTRAVLTLSADVVQYEIDEDGDGQSDIADSLLW